MELFERAAEAEGQLLRVARLAPLGGGDPTRAVAFLLTFDVGRILVAADPGAGSLVATVVPDAESAPSGLIDASEDEPWWRILGSSLARADGGGQQIALQFHASGNSSRTLGLALDGAQVRVSLQNA